jgi:acetolactate synthase-1/2/3 large subunit
MDETKHEFHPTGVDVPVKLPANRIEPEYISDLMVDVLASMDMDYAFLLPGSSYRGIHDSLVNYGRNSKPEIILCGHESIAISMAHGYAKATNKPAVAMIHDLVGLMNGSMNVYNAWCDRAPVIILGGSGPMDFNNRRGTTDWAHCASTQSALIKDYVKWTAEPPNAQATLDALVQAYRIAMTPPQGPVYVSLDRLIQETKITPDIQLPDPKHPSNQPPALIAANPDALEQAADLILGAKLPLIVGGRFGIRKGVSEVLEELLALTGAAYQDDKKLVCLATGHPQNLSGLKGFFKECDVMLTLDMFDLCDYMGVAGKNHDYRAKLPKIIDMSVNPMAVWSWSHFLGQTQPVHLQIVCDPLLGAKQLIEVVKAKLKKNSAWAAAAEARKKDLKTRHDALRKDQIEKHKKKWNDSPITLHRMTYEVYNAVKDKPWFLTVRNHRSFPEGIWQFPGSGQFMGFDGGGGVGNGPGSSVGSALSKKGTKSIPVAIYGDGEYMMYPAAVWTAVHYKVPLLLIINNNNTWANDWEHQVHIAHERHRPEDNAWIGQHMINPDPDYATVAKGFGAWAEGPITTPDALADALKRAVREVEAGGVAVLDVRTVFSRG